MTQKTFSAQTSVTINASIDKVWEALTSPAVIKQYLHDTDTKTDWVVGHPITWSGIWQGRAYEDKGTVLGFEPKKRLSSSHWSPLFGTEDWPEHYHIVTYELDGNNKQTTLTLTHSNSPTQQDADAMIENGWKPVLQTIKQILER